jgi:large subunit ribosomal protein L14e
MFELGRVCLKVAGREAGRYAVIVDIVDENFVIVSGPKTITGVKRRKCNVDHLEPTENKFEIEQNVDDNLLETQWKSSGLIEKLEIKVPVKRTKEKKAEEKTEQK